MNAQELRTLVSTLAARDTPRTEAQVQADLRQLLIKAPLDLEERDLTDVVLEAQAGGGTKIDIEVGATVIEVKRDLRKGSVRSKAVEQLAGYVRSRQSTTGLRYVGVLTDGAEWRCFHLVDGELVEVSTVAVSSAKPNVDGLLLWLEGVMATKQNVAPTPESIQARLGAESSAHALDRATLAVLYAQNRNTSSVVMERHLWARLLRTAFGTQFVDTDELFVEHTLLVNSAEIIAHAVLGLPVEAISPASLLSGEKFEDSGVYGVVEQDFFDWVVEVSGGANFIKTLARRLSRFAWHSVEHDVLKVLYESIIGRATRKKLGEYYTPDWLAEQIVQRTVKAPLEERLLDPACGSGTFLFHAIRRYIAAAETAGLGVAALLDGATDHVMGMDLHPVAVALARVTYLLALGRNRLTDPARGQIQIPVFLGDSMQWGKKRTDRVLSHGQLVIQADDAHELPGLASELRFPNEVLTNSRIFDQLVQELADRAADRKPGTLPPSLKAIFQRLAIPASSHEAVKATFATMCRLHDQGRDHIWGYYVRNLARPAWLARPENQVDVLIGNPPWLAFRHMPADMQQACKEMNESRELWKGRKWATQQDLSALFVARTIQLYLKRGGRFGFVMPSSVLNGGQYAGFRAGTFPDPEDRVDLLFEVPWDLRRVRPHFFPITASVIRGTRASSPRPLPSDSERWIGDLRPNSRRWGDVENAIRILSHVGDREVSTLSAYHERFAQGATIVPRVLFMVERAPASPLGTPAGREAVRSMRSATEKKPWKELPPLDGVVETEFIRPIYLGESVLPFRALSRTRAVIPYDKTGLMAGDSERIELFPGLAAWWRPAEELWMKHRSSERLTLLQRLDYMHEFTIQLPVHRQRVVYTKSGMHLSAARLVDRRAIVDHTLYWASVASDEEAHYLCAILNAEMTTKLVRPKMSYGKDERHIDKYVWQLPIAEFDPSNPLHDEISRIGKMLEEEIARLHLDSNKGFVWHRQVVRRYLATSESGRLLAEAVAKLLSN
ncbi:MAG TPA: N-6 DNA methylase [Kofleriaceae bacterium]